METNKIRKRFSLLIILGLVSLPFSAFAYTDQIALNIEEVWEAVNQMLLPHGIYKDSSEKKVIQSDWITDRVTLSKKPLPFKFVGEIKKSYERRYRLHIQLKEQDSKTQVIVRGLFQRRPIGIRPNVIWRRSKPTSEDYLVEKDFFFDLLEQLQKNKQAT